MGMSVGWLCERLSSHGGTLALCPGMVPVMHACGKRLIIDWPEIVRVGATRQDGFSGPRPLYALSASITAELRELHSRRT